MTTNGSLKMLPELDAWRRQIERTKPELLVPQPLRKPGLASATIALRRAAGSGVARRREIGAGAGRA
jgi:hypothetical protein